MASTDEQETEGGGAGRATIVIALTIGLAVGAGTGSFVVGPLLADAPGAPVDEAACEALFAEWEIEMRPPAPAAIYTIEDVILNPAQSGGTRFLMASVGFGMREATGVDEMTLRDAEIRDIVIGTLGAKTVTELADTGVRTEIKEEMRAEVANLLGQRAVIDVYFPKFVIQ
ncbi:MAG: flagellar basal body-associated FliL family protein [Gemmatimonadota bacterium]